jgi:outer membrane protein OmpA-like peptidoglycan-associated protein
MPVPPANTAKPGEAADVPLPKPEDVPERGKGKGKPDDKDQDQQKKPAPKEPAAPLSAPETQPVPVVPAERMQRPSQQPTTGDVNAPPPAPQVVPAATPPPVVTADPKAGIPPVRPERPSAQKPPSEETTQVLEDQGKRDRKADAQQAQKIEDRDDAKRLLQTILGVGAVSHDRSNQLRPGHPLGDRSRHGYRPPVEEVGRTQQDRERNVGNMVQRFQGRAPQSAPPGTPYRDPKSFELGQTHRHTQFYDGNRRVVRYSSMQEIPPVIVASQRLNRVQVMPLAQSAYNVRPQDLPQGQYYNEAPQSYSANDAYAVSYSVDPSSAISRDDILFLQGSTDFADAYSYDLVIDVAEALNAPALLKETFVIEGHASAEGDYGQNLLLSQERAERISRELVRHGVSAERLMPVGYGETEAAHPANAADSERSLDRRVMVFRMQ